MLVLPSDHLIKMPSVFADTLKSAAEVAQEGENLVTLGITPAYPETGYGYIKFRSGARRGAAYEVERFVEKPDRPTAERYLKSGDSKKKAVIVVSSNRGLAGGYNSNIIRLVTESGIPKEDALIFAIGRKGRDGLARKGYEIKADYSDVIDEPLYSDAQQISKELLAMFEKNEIGEIYLAYTAFKNTVSQIPTFLKLLPVDLAAAGPKGEVKEEKPDLLIMNYEPDEDEVLDAIIPKYVSSLIYGAFLEAVASENGARMTAMDSATNNAEEMIGKLSLQYNRARQGSITQELTEIIAGANAIDG